MTHPNTSHNDPPVPGAELIDLAPEAQELSAEDARRIRGGLLPAISKPNGNGKIQQVTDGTSNTLIFSEA